MVSGEAGGGRAGSGGGEPDSDGRRMGDEGEGDEANDAVQSKSLPPSRCLRRERRGLVASTSRSSPDGVATDALRRKLVRLPSYLMNL
jgi:hypothetical protein